MVRGSEVEKLGKCIKNSHSYQQKKRRKKIEGKMIESKLILIARLAACLTTVAGKRQCIYL